MVESVGGNIAVVALYSPSESVPWKRTVRRDEFASLLTEQLGLKFKLSSRLRLTMVY
jgi:hypothetical protein